MHRNELNYEMNFSHWEKMIPVMGKVDMEPRNKTADCFISMLG